MTDCIAIIGKVFAALISDAEAELVRAKAEHQHALDRVVDPGDSEDAAYTTQVRDETGAEVYAATAVADALIEARDEALRAAKGGAR